GISTLPERMPKRPMANEYYYCVSLSIVHPTADPRAITAEIAALNPRIASQAGSERSKPDGTPIVPRRKAVLSHWLADLHEEGKLYSGDKPISEFLGSQLARLEPYRALFAKLRQEGDVVLVIGWFSESNYSADVLSAEVLGKCGELGLDIELNCHGP